MQADAGLHAHQPPLPVGVQHAVEPIELQQCPVGHGRRAEGVAGAGHPHRPARTRDGGGDSARERGRTISTGRQRCEPDQLRHSIPSDGTVRFMDVAPEEVAELQRRGAAQLVDVREDYEWDAGRIPGARHVGLSELSAHAGSISRDTPVVFICRVGGRSTMAAQAFRRAGYDAYSLDGGMLAWAAHGLPMEPEGATVADH